MPRAKGGDKPEAGCQAAHNSPRGVQQVEPTEARLGRAVTSRFSFGPDRRWKESAEDEAGEQHRDGRDCGVGDGKSLVSKKAFRCLEKAKVLLRKGVQEVQL